MTVKWKAVKKDDSLTANGTSAANFRKHKPGPRGAARRVRISLDVFESYFTDEMLENIIT